MYAHPSVITSAEEGGYVFGSVCLSVCCVTSRREWALLLLQDVCLSVCLYVCLSVIPRPTAYHD